MAHEQAERCRPAGLALVAIIVAIFASDAYFNRMGTIADYETEGSAKGGFLHGKRVSGWPLTTRC